MEDDQKYQRISDLPKKLLFEISNMIHNYSTALVMYTTGPNGEEMARLIGSGTFVFLSDIFGILTAAHVAGLLRGSFSLGVSLKETEHKYKLNSTVLTIRKIAKGKEDSKGPDLALVILPNAEVGTIRATRNFYNLDRNRQPPLASRKGSNMAVCALCGIPDIQTTDQPSERGFTTVKEYTSYCYFGGIRNIYEVDDFDYCDFEIKYDNTRNIPETFGGVSGGGLWLIRLPLDEIIEAKDYILFGVAFYQTERIGIYRSIRCHGPKSIYEKVCKEILGENS